METLELLEKAELISKMRSLEKRVTDLERSEADLKQAEAKLYHSSILLESSVEGPQNMDILSLDKQYQYLYFNHQHSLSMQQAYGTNIKLGDCIFDHIKLEEDAKEVKAYYDKALSGVGHISIRESGSGSTHAFYETFYNPICDKHSKVVGVAVFAQNITDRKLAQKRAQESDSMRELLLDIITHDLKNPAGVIMGMAQFVKVEFPDNDLIDSIYRSSERLLQVLNDTSILSQATFGETIPKDYLNLLELLNEISDEFQSALHMAEMKLEITVDPDICITANHLIGEVFKNYISNAIKYASEGGHIQISATQNASNLEVSVRDFGPVIKESDRTLIFERRTQLSETQKRGRGLGLAIVKRIAQAHGGECWVEPAPDRGNKFFLRLPTSENLNRHD